MRLLLLQYILESKIKLFSPFNMEKTTSWGLGLELEPQPLPSPPPPAHHLYTTFYSSWSLLQALLNFPFQL